MIRRCSHCNNDGHNSRTCPHGGGGIPGGNGGDGGGFKGGGGGGVVKLFGVTLTDGSIMKKSASMGNLSHYHSSSSAASPNPSSPSADPLRDPVRLREGYLSDEPARATSSSNRRCERKKGVPWTEEEHRKFLIGLKKLGKGEWRGIARNFVVSRTPTQVASHAQKYFIRKSNGPRRKRRSSLFDMVPDMASGPPPLPEEPSLLPESSETRQTGNSNATPLDLSLKSDFEPMDATPQGIVEEPEELVVPSTQPPAMAPAFFPAYIPVSFPMWLPIAAILEEGREEAAAHEVLKPIPVLPKEPATVDEVVGMSQLSLEGLKDGQIEPSPLSIRLIGTPSRPSAFHASTAVGGTDVSDKESNAIQAI